MRSERSLIQIIGRAARNSRGKVIMYADEITASMRGAMDETARRRRLQDEYNKAHGITPKTVIKGLTTLPEISVKEVKQAKKLSAKERGELIGRLTREMLEASKRLDFEYAAELRDKIKSLRESKD